jgi:hypothetical protein
MSQDNWNTPPEIVELINKFKPIGFDPCPNLSSFIRPTTEFSGDGLDVDWLNKGLVFVNPPYSRSNYLKFVKRITAFGSIYGGEILALVPANIETKTWQSYLWKANAVCFPKYRIRFYLNGERGKSPTGAHALVYFGKDLEHFKDVFSELGKTIILNWER